MLPKSTEIDELAQRTDGPVLLPGAEGYEDASKIWNSRLQQYPAIVVQCTGPGDVIASVEFAREHGIELAVKGGGHDYGGHGTCDDGVLADLSAMDWVDVDPEARRARVGPGATWADVDAETQEHGLATTGVTVSTVGVAGSTLGGGSGHLARSQGLALDNVRSMEVVTADGTVRTASADENPDLFWALRGGSGNFGVVTVFEYALDEVGPEVLGGQTMHPIEDVEKVLAFYREFTADCPDELTCYAFVIPIPPIEGFPEEIHGEPAITLVASYVGAIEDGRSLVEPLVEFGDPLFASFDPMPYTALQSMFDDGAPNGLRWYSKAQYVDEITDGAIETVAEYAPDLHGPFSMVYFEPLGGEIGRVDPDATAFPHRDRQYSFHALCGWSDPEQDDEMIAWTDAFHESMTGHAVDGVYVNLLSGNEPERIPEAYGSNLDRLRAVKRRYDPDNVFATTHNIEPV